MISLNSSTFLTSTAHANDQLVLFKRRQPIRIYVSEQENSAVQIAVNQFVQDIEKVFDVKAELCRDADQCQIVIGTLTLEQTQAIAERAELSIEPLLDEIGDLRWEAFLQQAADDVFYIIGTDRRGTIYGIYDLSEAIGVSPWYYWADVPVKKKEEYRIPSDYRKVDWPSVPYRGIFINDEEEMENWAKKHTPDGTIGPTTYRHLFELLLRLKANYIWPAMHVNYFNENPENGALADRMGIVVGTSHCDMLLRSNQNEWEPWIKSKGYDDAEYDYSIEGRNREILIEYWRESVEQNRDYEVCYTVGMRGIHDSSFHTRAIDEDPTLNEEEKQAARVALLGQVIRDQQQILRSVLGEERERKSLKTFIPYKEVLQLYDQGLELPDDITLIWANDNFGHVRRYPNEAERKRKGGNGLYFHNSYWAEPGTAMSYLFINSIPLAQTGNELRKAYESGIQKLWILNVGGLKPLEQDMEFFLRYAWEAGQETGITKDAKRFTEHWINSNFSGSHGAEAAELYETFAQVTNVRKIEHMHSGVFSQTAYGDEAGRRLRKLEEIYRRGNAILYKLPEEEREAFFQLFLMKIHASYYTNHEYYYADRSNLAYQRGHMQAADRFVELSLRMMDYKRRMLHFYNNKMSGGKWDGMLTPESAPPPATAMHPARKPALKIDSRQSGLSIHLWNDEPVLRFSVYGRRQKWIELGNLGSGAVPYRIEIRQGAEWLAISPAKGEVRTECRVLVTALEPERCAGKQGLIVFHDLLRRTEFQVPVEIEPAPAVPEEFVGYIEGDGYIAFPAAGYHRNVFTERSDRQGGHCEGLVERCGWLTVKGIGRYEGDAVMAWHSDLRSCEVKGELRDHIEELPYLEYQLYFTGGGPAILEIYRNLTLNATGRIRFAVAIDDEAPILIESETRDAWMGRWQQAVFENGERIIVELPHITKGAHRLKLYMIDRYVTISKFVVYTGERRPSYLGPVTSWHQGPQQVVPVAEHGLESPEVNWEGIDQLCEDFYRTCQAEVPPPLMLYADRKFFERFDQQVYVSCPGVPQPGLGAPRYTMKHEDGSKDIIAQFGSGIFIEERGVLAIEAEYALENSHNACLTPSRDDASLLWSHLQAETSGRTGLAMHVAPSGLLWEDPHLAPAMNYRIRIQTPGRYRVWLLVWHYNDRSDSCYLALNGKVQPLSEQLGKGRLHTYNTAYMYYWCLLSELNIDAGDHLFSIIARKSQLRIDRIYLTTGDELPPIDAEWRDSARA